MRTIRAGRIPTPRPTHLETAAQVVPIEQLRAERLRSGGPRPPRGRGDLETPARFRAGAAIILRALVPVLVALVRVIWAAGFEVLKWTTVLAVSMALTPLVILWTLLRSWWWWVLLVLLLVL